MSDTMPGNGKKRLFDPTITLGSLIQVVILLGTILLGWASLETRITVLENNATQRTRDLQGITERLDIEYDKLNDISFNQGQTTTQLNDLIKQVDKQAH